LVARRRTLFHAIIPFFSQSWQILDIIFLKSEYSNARNPKR